MTEERPERPSERAIRIADLFWRLHHINLRSVRGKPSDALIEVILKKPSAKVRLVSQPAYDLAMHIAKVIGDHGSREIRTRTVRSGVPAAPDKEVQSK